MRRFDFAAVTTEVIDAEIVGENEKDVGFRRSEGIQRKDGAKGGQRKNRAKDFLIGNEIPKPAA